MRCRLGFGGSCLSVDSINIDSIKFRKHLGNKPTKKKAEIFYFKQKISHGLFFRKCSICFNDKTSVLKVDLN